MYRHTNRWTDSLIPEYSQNICLQGYNYFVIQKVIVVFRRKKKKILGKYSPVCGKNARGKIAIGKNVRGKIAIGKKCQSQSGKNTIGKNARGIDWVCLKWEIPRFSSFLSMISMD